MQATETLYERQQATMAETILELAASRRSGAAPHALPRRSAPRSQSSVQGGARADAPVPAGADHDRESKDSMSYDDCLPETTEVAHTRETIQEAGDHGDVLKLLQAMQTAIRDGESRAASAQPTPADNTLPPPRDASDSVQTQLQEQRKQLSLLAQLQQQLMTQQVHKANSVRAASNSQVSGGTSPWRQMPAPLLPPAPASAAPQPQPSVQAYPLDFVPTLPRPPVGAYGAVDPLPAPVPPALPAPIPAPLPGAFDAGARQHALAAYGADYAEEIEAKESVHRLITDFIAQKNLTNTLTERLAEKTNEAEHLRARIATGEGREHLQHMSEALTAYEKELAAERARALALEHEVYKLRLTLDVSGLPVPKVKADYEAEIQSLRRKLVHQEQLQADMRRRAEAEKEGLLRAAEGHVAGVAQHTHEALLQEVELLRGKLREKKEFNHELQAMLKLHLKCNAEARNKALLQQPEWTHPLLKGPTPSHQDVQNPYQPLEL
eukprot:TRINITY_DN20377_c0_g1_i1.p1 TRINITY_DN20377_c0_g1~~TRINITY_DN20377_c0_g1_i1.p1  ORF type:complete len:512 (+),score=203.83 TRINITY_DN20377_c0_g1_i1:53-1537(+)